jgi:acetyltransferase-like isoleucine patch superfamily enzyme
VTRRLPHPSRDRVARELFQRPRIWKFRAASNCKRVHGRPIVHQPLLLLGLGEISFGESVELGWPTSPHFWTGYCHLEATHPGSAIELGTAVQLNNNAFLKSEGEGIRIGAHGLLGSDVKIFDSDFHELDPRRRRGGTPRTGPVELHENVFVGEGSIILKGVSIGRDSVIGAGSVVSSSIPEGVIAAGNPARVVRELESPSPASVGR